MRNKNLEQYSAHKIAGLQIDLLQKLRTGNASIEQFEWFNNLTFEQREELILNQEHRLLKLISGSQTLTLDAVDGSLVIYKSSSVFNYIDRNTTGEMDGMKGASTSQKDVYVYELLKSATTFQMFSSLAEDLNPLCLTQHQILNFISKYRHWLSAEHGETFFLFESNKILFVASVKRVDERLLVAVRALDNGFLYSKEKYKYEYRLVTPAKGILKY